MSGKYFWASACIIAIWLAVAISAIAGGEFRTVSSDDTTEVPVVWGVALFAAIASVVLGLVAFRRDP